MAWLTRYWGGSDSHIGLKMVLAWDSIGRDLLRSQIEWVENCMEKDTNARDAKCGGCKVREPTQSARANAKCADCAMSVQDVKCQSARTSAKCVGRSSIAQAALSVRAAIAWRGKWAALHTHLPRTCHAMPRQCNRGSTRVDRDEPQLPGTLRVNRPIRETCSASMVYYDHMNT